MYENALNALTRPGHDRLTRAIFVALTLDASDERGERWIQILPAGEFRARDGRPEKVKAWRCDAQIAAKLIAQFDAQATHLVVDYEHQTLNATENGQPAPAAGWISALQWRDGQGLFGRIEWTERAVGLIRGNEYRYFSPVFASDPKTGAVTELLMGAITNFPGLDGLLPIAARSEATKDHTMNPLLAALIAALALGADTTEDQAVKAVNALKGLDLAKVRKTLGLADDADGAAILIGAEELASRIAERDTTITALKANAFDPAKFVPLATFDALKAELAKLQGQVGEDDVEQLIAAGLSDGRLHATQEGWARDLGKSNVAALRTYIETATPIAALKSTQTRGKKPEAETGEHGLTPDELAVCTRTGIAPEAFAKTKKVARV